jgi:erythromycin esterase
VLVVAHNVHVQSAPATGGPWDAYERVPTSMGQYLRATLGERLVVIGASDAASAPATAARTGTPGAPSDALVVVDALTPAHSSRPSS